MKKIVFIIALVFITSGCQMKGGNQVQKNRIDDNSNTKDGIEMDLPNCFDLCHNKIQDICMDDIVNLEASDSWYGDTILDIDHCDQSCGSWNDSVLSCIGKATKCDSISSSEPYCKEEEDNSMVEYIPEKETNFGCSSACYKYKACAMRADDATAEDGNSAYDTCFEECQNWSEQTLTCMKKNSAETAMGCANLSMCGLQEYK
jgi:hypothetical protein